MLKIYKKQQTKPQLRIQERKNQANEEATNPGLVDYWLAFTRDHDRTDAVRRFKLKFGIDPMHIFIYEAARLLLVGPEPEEIG
jgi:hypothetical protein